MRSAIASPSVRMSSMRLCMHSRKSSCSHGHSHLFVLAAVTVKLGNMYASRKSQILEEVACVQQATVFQSWKLDGFPKLLTSVIHLHHLLNSSKHDADMSVCVPSKA